MGNKAERGSRSESHNEHMQPSGDAEEKEQPNTTEIVAGGGQIVYQVSPKQRKDFLVRKRRNSRELRDSDEVKKHFEEGNLCFKATRYGDAQAAYWKAIEALHYKCHSSEHDTIQHESPHLASSNVIAFAEERYGRAHELMEQVFEQMRRHEGLVINETSTVSLLSLSREMKQSHRQNKEGIVAADLEVHASVDAMIADLLNNLAASYELQGNITDARTFYERSLKLRIIVHGPHSLKAAESMQNLATTLDQLGAWTDAERFLSQALEIEIQELGAKHVQTAVTMNNLGVLCTHLGMLDRAKDLLNESVNIRCEQYGSAHHLTMVAQKNLSLVESKLAEKVGSNTFALKEAATVEE